MQQAQEEHQQLPLGHLCTLKQEIAQQWDNDREWKVTTALVMEEQEEQLAAEAEAEEGQTQQMGGLQLTVVMVKVTVAEDMLNVRMRALHLVYRMDGILNLGR